MYLSTGGIFVVAIMFLGLLFVLTPWLYLPYLRLLEARDALEGDTATSVGAEAVGHLEQRLESEWQGAKKEISAALNSARQAARDAAAEEINTAKLALQERAKAEEDELEATLTNMRGALEGEVDRLASELVTLALGRQA